MAKKKKQATNSEKINEALLDNMQMSEPLEPETPPAPTPDSEDEFDALLRSFIDPKDDSLDDDKLLNHPVNAAPEKPAQAIRQEAAQSNLSNDENELATAYANFIEAVSNIAEKCSLDLPNFIFDPQSLSPNYKPSIGRKIVADTMLCWDILFAAYPEKLANLDPNSKDEEFLNFAETLANQDLQLAIISYVEILIDIENCEISYEERRIKAQRRRIERILYNEYLQRQELRQKFIQAINKKKFPINAERLIDNYLKNSLKDEKGAYQALVSNPATFAPIEISKIKPHFFGLIKASPKDGIRENYKIGAFLKHLKV